MIKTITKKLTTMIKTIAGSNNIMKFVLASIKNINNRV